MENEKKTHNLVKRGKSLLKTMSKKHDFSGQDIGALGGLGITKKLKRPYFHTKESDYRTP